MRAEKSSSGKTADLRQRAEAFLDICHDATGTISIADVKKLVRDLQAHQLELEMQNKELREAQTEVAHSRDSYAELYDFAPVGYLTLDRNGVILGANHTAATILGAERGDLLRRKFPDFVDRTSLDELFRHQRHVLATNEKDTVELDLNRTDGTPFTARLECRPRPGDTDEAWRCWMVLSDVTAQKLTEDELRQAHDNLERRVAERTAELAESEERFRAIFEQASDGIILADPATKQFHAANRAACEMLGYDEKELCGMGVADIHPEADVPRVADVFEKQARGEFRLATDIPLKRRDGRALYADISAFPLVLDGKRYLVGIFRDITERKQAEARAKAALDRLQAFEAAVNQGPGIVFRWRVAPGEWPVEMVTANVRQLGYEPEDFLSGRVSWPGITHPDDIPRLEAQVGEYLEKGIHQFHQHYRLLTKSGDVRNVEDWNLILTDKNGNPAHIQAIALDVTHHRRERQRRHESEEKFRNLAEQSPNMIFINDSGRVAYANAVCEEIMGYTREEFYAPDFDFRVLHAPESVPLIEARFEQQMKGEELPPCEITLLKKNGESIEAILSTRLLDYEGGKAILGILTDITARNQAKRLRVRQQEQLRHLAARLASAQDDEQRRIAEGLHDDVAQILTACSVKMAVAERSRSPDEARAVRDEVSGLLKEANEKVRSLSFELSSSTLCRLGLREAVHELCECMSARYGVRFELKGNGHALELDEATATVLFKAVRELLFNVARHANVETATVSMCHEGKMLTLAVEDHGTGFPQLPEDEPLAAGRGLGLFGIKERLMAVDGEMQIESTPGVRTRVTLSVPVLGDRSSV